MTSRLTIAGLMAGVLITALGLAALRWGSEAGSSVTFLITCGVLAFSIVGAVCGGPSTRPWWVGFGVFGWGYMAWAFVAPYFTPWRIRPPSREILEGAGFCLFNTDPRRPPSYDEISHCLCGLVVALLGGLLARLLYPPRTVPLELDRGREPQSAERRLPGSWLRAAVSGLVGLVALACFAVAGSRTAPGMWAGATLFLTWALLGLAAIGAVGSRGVRRARWFGAALFGMGYLALVSGHEYELGWPRLASNRLLSAARPWLPAVPVEFPSSSDKVAAANVRILKALDQTVPMRLPKETPLEDFVKYVESATRGPDGRKIPIYVDPIGLQEVEKTLQSPVSLNLEDLPLRATLPVALDQLGLVYQVREGVLRITARRDDEEDDLKLYYDDPFLLTGRCVLALVAAGLGFILAPLVSGPHREASER